MQLSPSDFSSFFRAIHGDDPFPWQKRLVKELADGFDEQPPDRWRDVLDLPTGSGKTAALDAAIFHLALRFDEPSRAALRIALVVDRRLVVDDAFSRAKKIAKALRDSLAEEFDGNITVREVARRLCQIAGAGGSPLVAKRLRGGAPLEYDWARTPTQPTILCSTVDQVGSRLLFRGYGVSDRMRPVHAGLLGTDTLILLDEAHLAEPFRQTLDAVCEIGKAQIKVALLSATPGIKAERPFRLSDEDRVDATLRKRLEARKPATLLKPVDKMGATAEVFADEARNLAERLQNQGKGITSAAVGIVVNRVALAREIFSSLRKGDNPPKAILMIGPSRSVDRDSIINDLAPFRTGSDDRESAKSLFVVATQCLEVGVDLDLDGLVTQAASLDALRQRFGRLNRAGREIDTEGVIIARAEDIDKKADDPVYGDRIRMTWEALDRIADDNGVVDFGVEALPQSLANTRIDPDSIASERQNAPVVMPAYLDLWSQTSPQPTADPDTALFLHGTKRKSPNVSVIWRSDISKADLENNTGIDLKEIMRLVPPRSAESIELPLWAVRAWLQGETNAQSNVSDAPENVPDLEKGSRTDAKQVFCWDGQDSPATGIIEPEKLRTGNLLVVPSEYGGCDKFGWAPESKKPVIDVADKAAKSYWGRRCAVRITRNIVRTDSQWDKVKAVLAAAEDAVDSDLPELLLAVLPSGAEEDEGGNESRLRDVREPLEALRHAKGRIELHFPYADGGAILVAERGISKEDSSHPKVLCGGKVLDTGQDDGIAATEDETASHAFKKPVSLDCHGKRVARYARGFAETLGLKNDVTHDLGLAAWLHDAGKADPRFQVMLAGGDSWNRPEGPALAKSARYWSPKAWERAMLPKGWRHEALSVRMARGHPKLESAHDPALVLWLIGSHHGLGRPFFNFLDTAQKQPLPCLGVPDWRIAPEEAGPQSLAFDFNGFDWPALFADLKRRYGIWGLAHLEAMLRLADHRASEEERSG